MHSQTPLPQLGSQSALQESQFSSGAAHTESPQKQSRGQFMLVSPQLMGSQTPSPQWQSMPQFDAVSLQLEWISSDAHLPGNNISRFVAVHQSLQMPLPHRQSSGQVCNVSPRSASQTPSPHAQSLGHVTEVSGGKSPAADPRWPCASQYPSPHPQSE